MGNVHKVPSSDTLEICRSKMDPTFFSGRSDLPVGSQIIIKYDSVLYLSALVHILHHQAPGAIQHSGSCELTCLDIFRKREPILENYSIDTQKM